MTLLEMKKKVLQLIEEIDEEQTGLTSDPDIEAKMNSVINQVMYEVARMKKIPDYTELEVEAYQLVKFEDIKAKTGFEVYQLGAIRGVDYELKASGTVIKALEQGTLEVDYYKYPERITDETDDSYEFELSPDALEILPYGVAADLLKSDVSTQYGAIYSQRYETMLQRLDPRYSMDGFSVEGGIDV